MRDFDAVVRVPIGRVVHGRHHPTAGRRVATVLVRDQPPRHTARLAQATGRHTVEGFVVHQPAPATTVTTALLPGVKAVGLTDLLEALAGR
jgi:hypothetical protein